MAQRGAGIDRPSPFGTERSIGSELSSRWRNPESIVGPHNKVVELLRRLLRVAQCLLTNMAARARRVPKRPSEEFLNQVNQL